MSICPLPRYRFSGEPLRQAIDALECLLLAATLPMPRPALEFFADTCVGRRGVLAACGALLAATLVSGCETSSTVSTGPNPVKCLVSLGATPMMDAVGGSGTLTITTQPECAWDVSTSASWISALAPTTGQGTGDVSFRVAANDGSSTRDGMIVVNGEQARVSQRAPCRYEIAPASQNVVVGGGSGSITVMTASECSWTATAEVGWITLTSSATGTGGGRVSFTVAPNQSVARTGTIAIANQRPTVTQAGVSIPAPPSPQPPSPQPPSPPPPQPPASCSYSVSPTSLRLGRGGSTASINVSTSSTCSWAASSNTSWITVTSGASGTGSGTVTFSFTRNESRNDRTGSLTVAGRTVSVEQNGGGGNNDD